MLGKFNFVLIKDNIWLRVVSLALVLFFIFLSDAILSFWVPVYFEQVFKRATIGYKETFVVMGIATIVICGVLFFVTPKKLLLPRAEIEKWKD